VWGINVKRVPKGMGVKESLLKYEDEDDKAAMTDDMTEMTENDGCHDGDDGEDE